MDDDDDLVDLYRTYKPTAHALLKCSPFQGMDSLDGLLTPEIFFRHLFVKTSVLQGLEQNLKKALSNEYRN